MRHWHLLTVLRVHPIAMLSHLLLPVHLMLFSLHHILLLVMRMSVWIVGQSFLVARLRLLNKWNSLHMGYLLLDILWSHLMHYIIVLTRWNLLSREHVLLRIAPDAASCIALNRVVWAAALLVLMVLVMGNLMHVHLLLSIVGGARLILLLLLMQRGATPIRILIDILINRRYLLKLSKLMAHACWRLG
jgi:hypothetical protein